MLLDDFSVSCKQRLLTLQFENELDGACYSLLAALLLVWSPCCRIFKFNAVYIFFFSTDKKAHYKFSGEIE